MYKPVAALARAVAHPTTVVSFIMRMRSFTPWWHLLMSPRRERKRGGQGNTWANNGPTAQSCAASTINNVRKLLRPFTNMAIGL